MTAHTSLRAGGGVVARLRSIGAIAAVAALSALVALGPPGDARAATNSYDQITGIGQTDSAITVPWAQGLLDNGNSPITSSTGELASNSDRAAGTGPLSFMYNDFKNLKVSVSKTQNIAHEGGSLSLCHFYTRRLGLSGQLYSRNERQFGAYDRQLLYVERRFGIQILQYALK